MVHDLHGSSGSLPISLGPDHVTSDVVMFAVAAPTRDVPTGARSKHLRCASGVHRQQRLWCEPNKECTVFSSAVATLTKAPAESFLVLGQRPSPCKSRPSGVFRNSTRGWTYKWGLRNGSAPAGTRGRAPVRVLATSGAKPQKLNDFWNLNWILCVSFNRRS